MPGALPGGPKPAGCCIPPIGGIPPGAPPPIPLGPPGGPCPGAPYGGGPWPPCCGGGPRPYGGGPPPAHPVHTHAFSHVGC